MVLHRPVETAGVFGQFEFKAARSRAADAHRRLCWSNRDHSRLLPGLPHSRPPRLRRRPTQKPRKIGYCRMIGVEGVRCLELNNSSAYCANKLPTVNINRLLVLNILVSTFLFSWVIGNEASSPVHSFEQEVHHWVGPNGMLFDLDSFQPLDSTAPPTPPPPTVQKTIEMPDGKTVAYPGTTSDEAIKAEWRHKLNIATAKAALSGFGIALLVTVIFSYLLQASYRELLYVIYGAKAGAAPDNPVVQ